MTRLLNADLNRVLKSKGFWISTVLMVGMIVAFVYMAVTNIGTNPADFLDNCKTGMTTMGMTWIILTTVFTMFNHDLKSRVHQAAVGNGISRMTVTLTKFTEALILGAINFALFGGALCVTSMVAGVALSGAQMQSLLMMAFGAWIGTAPILALVFVPVFAIGNLTAAALIGVLVSLGLANQIVSLIGGAVNVNLSAYGIVANLNSFMESLTSGPFNVQSLMFLMGWAAAGLAAAVFFYKKKELEF